MISFIALLSFLLVLAKSDTVTARFYSPPLGCNVTGTCCEEEYLNGVWIIYEPENLFDNYDCALYKSFGLFSSCSFNVYQNVPTAIRYECESFVKEDLPGHFKPIVVQEDYKTYDGCLQKKTDSMYYRYFLKYSSCRENYCILSSKIQFTTLFDGTKVFQTRGCYTNELLSENVIDKCTNNFPGTDYNSVMYVPNGMSAIESYSPYETCKASRFVSASPVAGGRLCGDPHFTTFDGNRYSFQGLGEYYLVRTNDFDLTVTLVKMKGSNSISVTQSFKLFYKNHEFEVSFDPDTEGYSFIFDNGNPLDVNSIQTVMKCGSCVSLAMLTGDTTSQSGQYFKDLTISFSEFELYKATVEFNMEDGTKIIANHRRGWWCMSVLLSEGHFGKTRGLLGLWNRKKLEDYIVSDGSLYTNPTDEDIWKFGVSWEVGTSKARRKMLEDDYEPNIIQDVESYLESQGIDIDTICTGITDEQTKINCAYDVAIGGIDESLVTEQYTQLEDKITESAGDNTAPFVAGNTGTYNLIQGEKFDVTFKIFDNEDDDVIANIYNNSCEGFTINIEELTDDEDGAKASLKVTGKFSKDCQIIVNVSDTKGLSRMTQMDLTESSESPSSSILPAFVFIIIGVGVFGLVAALAVLLIGLGICGCCLKNKILQNKSEVSPKEEEMKDKTAEEIEKETD